MSRLDRVEGRTEHDPAAVDQCNVVGYAFDLVKQVRREQDGTPLLGDGANDRRQNLPATIGSSPVDGSSRIKTSGR